MKQGMRAMAGWVVGLLATAGPAMAKDRVLAVDGVSTSNADRRVEILVHVPDGQDANAAAERALAGQGAKKAPKPPEPQSNSGPVHWALLGHAQRDAELQPGRLAADQRAGSAHL